MAHRIMLETLHLADCEHFLSLCRRLLAECKQSAESQYSGETQ
jgi:hypothetical protein